MLRDALLDCILHYCIIGLRDALLDCIFITQMRHTFLNFPAFEVQTYQLSVTSVQ